MLIPIDASNSYPPAPPEQEFTSFEIVYDAMQDFARDNGYALILTRAKLDGKQPDGTPR
jgi:hypothetical protein